MSMQFLVAMLVVITALASYLNSRFFKLPKSIGLTAITLGMSLIIMVLLSVGQHWVQPIKMYLSGINFSDTVLNGMISYLLFAGAININTLELSKHKNMIASLATASVLISCLIIGYVVWYVLQFLGINIPLIYALLFGALIAPTDPVGVLNAMKRGSAPLSIKMKITGEALFNDAAGIFLFVILVEILHGQANQLNFIDVSLLLIRQGVGGIILGYALGLIVSYFLRRGNNDETAILLTLALVTGGYALALELGVSGPICMVVAGLLIGSRCRKPHFSGNTVKRLYSFWGLVDDMLNSFLFVMIGLEILSISAHAIAIVIGLIAFVIIIIARGISIIAPSLVFEPLKDFSWRTTTVMTWGGMRGGLSIALALTLPEGYAKDIILSITYVVVICSIVLQGLSLKPMVSKLFPTPAKLEDLDALDNKDESTKDKA